MPIPTWVDGNPLPASDVNSWFVPRAAVKTATETVTSSAVLQNDDELFVTVDANATYRVELTLRYQAATAADLQGGWTMPAGANIVCIWAASLDTAATGFTNDLTSGGGTTLVAGGVGSGTDTGYDSKWYLTTAGTSGLLRFQWAQLASFATGTNVLAGSMLIAQRLA